MKQIYLDNQASTPIDPIVLSEMQPWLQNKFGNPSSKNHIFGWEANEGVEKSRELVANIINANPKEIIFTSGATESNNIAIQGITKCYPQKNKHIITVRTEHKAVLDICDFLEKDGYKVTRLNVDKSGQIDLKKLEDSIQKNTILISVMHVNNEIGLINPINLIGEICKNKKILFHVDAAQSIGKISVDVNKMYIDLLSLSGHKIYGPKGIGALYIKRKKPQINIKPIFYGGNQELGLRSGTLPVANIIGLGKACQISNNLMTKDNDHILKLRTKLLKSLLKIHNIKINGCMNNRIAGNLNICFPGINNEALISSTPEIAFSTGSACTTSNIEPSHVLLSMGLSKKDVYSSIRISIGRFNTDHDIDTAINSIETAIKKISNIF